MKIKELTLKNFANFKEVSVSSDDNVTYLIGNNGAGKSSIGLMGIWFIFQGIAEKQSKGKDVIIGERFRFIGDFGKTASGEITLYDEKTQSEIKVIRKLTKDTSFISFIAPEGMELDQKWLDDLFNVFMINPKKFTELSSKEQALALGIDTNKFDSEIKELRGTITQNRTAIKAIDQSIQQIPLVGGDDNVEDPTEVEKLLKDANDKNERAKEVAALHEQYQKRLKELEDEVKVVSDRIRTLPPITPLVDTTELTNRWKKSLEQKGNLQSRKTRETLVSQKDKLIEETTAIMEKVEEVKANRADFIQSFKLQDKVLSINEEGELLLRGKPIKEPYFSSGELIKIIPAIFSQMDNELKFIFLQDFSLLDDENRDKIVKFLINKGYQLVIEIVGEEPIKDKNCIILREGQVVTGDDPPDEENFII
jgi:DNA repair ATPase RecN